jgi:hypothetical protein
MVLMMTFVCEQCNKTFYDETLPRRGEVCFGCHIRSLHLQFSYGKEDFHGPTVKQRQDEQMRLATEAGIKAEPVGQRWV